MANLSDKYKNSLPFESSNIATITSNYTALDNDVIFVNTASSSLTVTLPSSPNAGSKIKVLDIAANAQNNIITILGNGKNIAGASAYIINTPDSSADLIYINSNKGWNVSNEYVSISKPETPTSISAVDVGTERAYNNGAATVSFTPSTSGDSATSYTVTSTPGSFSTTGTSSPLVVTGLESNTSYTFKVYATNVAGNSAESTASGSITATTVPQTPTINSVSVGFERLLVNYTQGFTGGKSVSSYTATRTGAVTASGTSPIEFSGLTGGTSYTISMTATNANGTSIASNSVVQTPFTASGGLITTYSNFRVHSFTGTSNFTLTGNSISADYLVVAGGGSGGSSGDQTGGAGGGAGGYRTGTFTLTPNSYTATIGSGANANGGGRISGNKGASSSFIGGSTNISSTGGGFGAASQGAGGVGGSGGGSQTGNAGALGNEGGYTPIEGYAGGSGAGSTTGNWGGGGGGAGGAGQGTGSGTGGVGASNSIRAGGAVTYSTGGQGGRGNAGGANGAVGSANTGNGGGGANGSGNSAGGAGGSGIIVIRYAI
jgi:hypothetical protein